MQTADAAHPDADLLTAFVEQLLMPREREQLLAHLAVCPDCREVIGLVLPETPELVVQPAPKPAFWRWPVLRWGTVAASVVIIVGAVTVGLRERTGNKSVTEYIHVAVQKSGHSASTQPSAPGDTSRSNDVISENRSATGASGLKSAQIRYEKLPEDQKVAARAELDKLTMSPAPAARAEIGQAAMGNAVRDTSAMSKEELSRFAAERAPQQKSGWLVEPVDPHHALNAALPKPLEVSKESPLVSDVRGIPPPPPPPPPSSANEVVVVKQDEDKFAYSQNSALGGTAKKSATEHEVQALPAPQLQASSEVVASTARHTESKAKELRKDSDASGFVAGQSSDVFDMSQDWRIATDGELQRSPDKGKSWLPVMAAAKFRSLAVVGTEVWVGGAKRLLMHSIDAGQSWMNIVPKDKNVSLTGDVVSIRFADQKKGSVVTSSGETWTTEDGGQNWRKP